MVATPEDMIRECLGSISRVAANVIDDAMDNNIPSLKVHYNFLKSQMARLEVLEKNIPRKPVRF